MFLVGDLILNMKVLSLRPLPFGLCVVDSRNAVEPLLRLVLATYDDNSAPLRVLLRGEA